MSYRDDNCQLSRETGEHWRKKMFKFVKLYKFLLIDFPAFSFLSIQFGITYEAVVPTISNCFIFLF